METPDGFITMESGYAKITQQSKATLFMDVKSSGAPYIVIIDGAYKSYYLGHASDNQLGAYYWMNCDAMAWEKDCILVSKKVSGGRSVYLGTKKGKVLFQIHTRKSEIEKSYYEVDYTPASGMGYSDVLDFVPVVGAVNRTARGVGKAITGQECGEEFMMAGLNAGGDVMTVMTAGASKAGSASAKVALKASKGGVRQAIKSGAKAGAKELTAKQMKKTALKSLSKKQMTNMGIDKLGKKAIQKGYKKGVEQGLKKSVKSGVKKGVKSGTKSYAKGKMKQKSKQYAKDTANEIKDEYFSDY